MTELAETLQTYGGWGATAVCLVAIWRMAAYIRQLHEQQRASDAASAEAHREETRETITAMIETRDALRAFKDAMEALATKLERS